jgi:hypothetical protein
MAVGWEKGLVELELAVENSPPEKRCEAEFELLIAQAARLHFKSVANQTRFVLLRDALADDVNTLSPSERKEQLDEICRMLEEEIAVAREMFTLARANSCVGYESASQYFYLPLDLVEKLINCHRLLDHYTTQRQRPDSEAE